MKRWLCLTSVVLIGCQTETTQFVSYPPVSSDFVALYSAAADGTGRVEAVGSDARHPLEAAPGEVWILEYAAGLEALGLTPGVLSNDEMRDCRLLDPDVVWRSSSDYDWVAAELTEGTLDTLVPDRKLRCDRCIDFDYERVRSDGAGRGIAALLESGAVLFTARASLLRIVEREPRAVRGCTGADRGWMALLGLGGNRFLGGTVDGRLAEFSIDESNDQCTVDESTRVVIPAADPPVDPGGSGTTFAVKLLQRSVGGDVEAIAGMSDGRLMGRSRTGWSELGRLAVHPTEFPVSGAVGLVRLASGDIVFTSGSEEVGFLEDGVFRIERVSGINTPATANANRISALEYVDGLGLLIGTGVGRIRRRVGDEWPVWLELEDAPNQVGAIAAYPNGLVVTLDGGRLFHWHEARGLCPEPTLALGSAGGRGRNLLVDGWRVVVGDFAGDQDSVGGVDWFDPR